MTTSEPTLTTPLVVEPAQSGVAPPTTALGPLQHLVGTWTNQDLGMTGKGGTSNPYSYNMMPLPQVDTSSPYGFILKNFTYYEEITFSAILGTAPNRGGTGTQVANTLLYEQRVYFADGPAKNSLVHAENGSWLFLSDRKQLLGPYGDAGGGSTGHMWLPGSKPPKQAFNLVKQMSVPHGNSILALGNHMATSSSHGAPMIPENNTIPSGLSSEAEALYTTMSPVSNPNPTYAVNPNQVLSDAITAPAPVPTSYIKLEVDSKKGAGGVTNIGFEQQHANVTEYAATYWLEAFGAGSPASFTQLQYSQTILMEIPMPGGSIVFPHVTTNTLTKLQS